MTYNVDDATVRHRIQDAWTGLSDGGTRRRLPEIDIVLILKRNFKAIAIFVVVVTSLTAWWLARQPPIYAARAALVIEASDTPSETDDRANAAGPVTSSTVFTEIEVMRARGFAERLADRLDLLQDPRFNPALAEYSMPSALESLLIRLGLSEKDDPRDAPPEVLRDNAVTNLMGLYSVSGSANHSVVDITARHSDPELARRIANGIATLYLNNSMKKETASLDRRIRFLTARSNELALSLTEQQVAMTNLIQDNKLRDDEATRILLAELKPLQNRLDNMAQGATGRAQIEARIAAIDRILNNRVSAEIELVKQEFALQTDMKRYDSVTQRLGELEAQRDAVEPNARQISAADVPKDPVGPNTLATLVVTAIASAALAAVMALIRDGLDRRVREQDQTEAMTGLPVLASVPKLPWRVRRNHTHPHLVVAADALPSFCQAIRSLITAVHSGATEDGGRFVFVGSPISGEGKSSIATSMAVAAAKDDLKVLIIDFDVHRSGASRALGVPAGTDTVGRVLSDPALMTASIKSTGIDGLDMLNFQRGSPFSRKILNDRGVKESQEVLRRTYDLIIMDTPPYLVSEESNRLDSLSDVAILVSRWGRSSKHALAQTVARMQRHGFQVVGIAVNGVDARGTDVYGYSDYGYYDRQATE